MWKIKMAVYKIYIRYYRIRWMKDGNFIKIFLNLNHKDVFYYLMEGNVFIGVKMRMIKNEKVEIVYHFQDVVGLFSKTTNGTPSYSLNDRKYVCSKTGYSAGGIFGIGLNAFIPPT